MTPIDSHPASNTSTVVSAGPVVRVDQDFGLNSKMTILLSVLRDLCATGSLILATKKKEGFLELGNRIAPRSGT